MNTNYIMTLRNTDVINAFFDSLKSMRKQSPYVSQEQIIENTIRQGAPRFYTTYENARRFVSLLDRGKNIPLVNSNKIAMYHELFQRYREIKQQKPQLIGYTILEEIIEQPAPSFYIDIKTLRYIIYKSYKK